MMSATKTTDTTTATTTTTITLLVADILSEDIAAAYGDTANATPTNTYVRRPHQAPTATSGLICLILVDTATQAQARDLTTLAFIDVRRTDAPAILHHATTTSAKINNNNTAASAILKAVRKTLRIERNAAKAARKAVAHAANLLDRLADTEVEEEEEIAPPS
jgi:hypothetical protein